ncbi:pyruvate kinase, partial [Patescibacteria group bacterium]|nr:pyruvate kinase [Patescibacteria group bacterium]
MPKKTKIVATIGPASDSKEKLQKMIEAGMNVARINFSHGTHASNGQSITNLKEIRKEMGIPIGIVADLQGPRIRIMVGEEVKIEKGEVIFITDNAENLNAKTQISNDKSNLNNKIKKIGLDVKDIINNIEIGNEILIEDGTIKLKVVKKEKEYLEAEVMAGGIVKNHKGVNIPDA